ncbi:MAG: helix-turn-helix transcriptional regulator [Alphaproteobacteria bacterium]|nr:helix-turn-helix transcriptional regulator [Alphaproteobacteria bacterium]
MSDRHSDETARQLSALGARVRRRRAKRGLSRRILAQESGVSERYLAQLESGAANPTVSVLRQVADAMDVDLAELATGMAAPPKRLAAIIDRLTALSDSELAQVEAGLARAADGNGVGQRAGRIALVGLRGAGKTTLGRRLAEDLGVPFIELNRLIEQEYGGGVGEIMALNGQTAFRRYERKMLQRIIDEHTEAVISTAGGIVSESDTYAHLLERCHTIWIQAAPEEHMARVIAQGDLRPMARNKDAMTDLETILDSRAAEYGRAQQRLMTSGDTIPQSADKLRALAQNLLQH